MEQNIKIAANCVIALDGIHPVSLKKGEVRLVPDHIAESLLADGRATKPGKVSYETKEAKAAEAKAEKSDKAKAAKEAKKNKK